MKLLWRSVRAGKRKAALEDITNIVIEDLHRTMRETITPELLDRFETITDSWDHKVSFTFVANTTPKEISVEVFPTGNNAQIWQYVNDGTDPHVITPKNASVLAFTWGGPGSYNPKTRKGVLAPISGGGSVSGGKKVFRPFVNHSGYEGRELNKAIADDYLPDFRRHIENSFRRTVDKLNKES